jgi:hypothetical protein
LPRSGLIVEVHKGKATFMVDIYISERANFPTDEGLRPLVRPECSVISGGGGKRKEERKERCRL